MSDNAAGWQPDPTGKHDHRYWDGSQWTDNVADAGVAATDPYEAPVEAAATESPAAEPEPATPAPEAPTVVTPVAGDDTTGYPIAGAPPPYVPPTPAPAAGGGGGGSKRGLVIGGAILAAVAIAVVAFLLLGGDDDESVESQLAAAIADDEDFDVSDEQAQCIADLVVEQAGEDAFRDTDFDADDPPQEFVDAVFAIGPDAFIDECGIDEEAFSATDGSTDSSDEGDDGGEETVEDLENACADGDFSACDDLYFSAEAGSELEDFGSTCGGIADPQDGLCEITNGGETSATDGFTDGNVEDILKDTYQEMFGLTDDQAECLAERLTELIESGEINEEQAMTEFFDYLSDCDISIEDLEPSAN